MNITTSETNIKFNIGGVEWNEPKSAISITASDSGALLVVSSFGSVITKIDTRDNILINGITYTGIDVKPSLLKALTTEVKASLNTSSQIDAGGRLRTSQLVSFIDAKQVNDDQPLLFSRETNGVGASQTYDSDFGATNMVVTNAGNFCISQTKTFAPYFSGKSQLIEATAINFQNENSDDIKRVGYYSSSTVAPYTSNLDGIFFEASNDTHYCVIMRDGVEMLKVSKEDWNNYNQSEDWFNPTNFNIYVFDFLYLGGSMIRFGIFNNGEIQWVHKQAHAGNFTTTFIKSPSQPVRYEIRSTGGNASLKQVCCMVGSENGVSETGVPVSINILNYAATTTNTKYAMLGVRHKQGFNNVYTTLKSISTLSGTNDRLLIQICYNPTINGVVTFNDIDNSSLQSFQGAITNTVSDVGRVLESFIVNQNNEKSFDEIGKLFLGSEINGANDTIVVVCTPLSNGASVSTTLNLIEYP